MNERIAGGNTHRVSPGLTNGSPASVSRGMTNGLGGRTNGMTNGLGGRTNGLTNGLGGRTNGMTNGLGGRTNGLTNGLGGRTNGMTNGLGGRTNGLTNGLGPGGPVMRSRRMDNSAISPFRISLIIVIAFVLLVPASFLLVSQNEAEYSGIRVDADFSDWDDALIFADPEQHAMPGLDIVNYAAGTNDAGGLFLYASARGNWFSASEADSLMVFIDSDGNPATGYSVEGLGAECVAEVYGWNGEIHGRQLGIFSGQDQLNWSAWNWRSMSAAFGLTQVEMGIQSSLIQLEPTHSMLFLTKRGDSVADVCDAAIGLDRGALIVKQTPVTQTGIVTTDSLMTLELTALGSAVDVDAIDFAYSGLSAPTVSSLDQGAVTVQPGTPVTLTVTSSVSGLNSGTFLSLEVSAVTGTGVPSITGDKLSAYAHAAPGMIRVDGAFADWTGVNKTLDTDSASNPNIDIANHASVNSSAEAFFYLGLAAGGRMFGGSSVPVARSIPGTPGEPGEPGTPTPLPKVSGEDVTRIYINTKSGGQITYGIQADYMIEIKGRGGEITSRRMYSLPGRTFLMNIDAVCGAGQLEAGVALDDIDYTGTFAYVMESTDWQSNADRTLPTGLVGVTPGTRGTPEAPEIHAGTLTYISAPTLSNTITVDGARGTGEWDGANTYGGADFDLYVLLSGNYLYVAVAVTSDTAAHGSDGCILYFDQDHTGTGTPQAGDRKFMSFDTTGTSSNTGYVGDGTGWTVDFLLDWTAASSLDGSSVVYEFRVGIAEVWGTGTPTEGQTAGFAVDIWDSDESESYCWGSGSVSDTDLGTWGDIVYAPEYRSIIIPIIFCAIPVIAYRSKRRCCDD